MSDLSRRQFTAAIAAALTGAAGPKGETVSTEPEPKPVELAGWSGSCAEREARKCRHYYHDDLGCHPAVSRAILALILFDQACDFAWGEYEGLPGLHCDCTTCLGHYDDLMMMEPVVKLFRNLLHGGVRGGEEAVVAIAPSIIREYLENLAQDFEDDLSERKGKGELPDADAWAGPLAEVATWRKSDDAA